MDAVQPNDAIAVRPARRGDMERAGAIMRPFVERGELIPRSVEEIADLMHHGFVAERSGRIVGFAAIEVYSWKISEIQCLSFEECRDWEPIAEALVSRCLEMAHEEGVLEVLAIVPPPLEPVMVRCGFHAALPGQKKAMFLWPAEIGPTPAIAAEPLPEGMAVRQAMPGDLPAVRDFLKPFSDRGELLPRSDPELQDLLPHGFVAESGGPSAAQVIGFSAIEVYSPKLAEIQGISVDAAFRGKGIGRRLIARCVERAKQLGVAELIAITPQETVLRSCGFDFCLPSQQVALFVKTRA